jgi:hypothetical protein
MFRVDKFRERGTSVSRWLQTQDLHSATSQKTSFIVTAVELLEEVISVRFLPTCCKQDKSRI